jgi:hydroxyproline dehydrogenase
MLPVTAAARRAVAVRDIARPAMRVHARPPLFASMLVTAQRALAVRAPLLRRPLSTTSAGTVPPARAALPLDLDDTRTAFASKTTGELLRAFTVFHLSAMGALVRHSPTLLAASRRVLGVGATHAILRHTFFGHFCAGEDAVAIRPVVQRLADAGIGAILDFAAEADVGSHTSYAPAPPAATEAAAPEAAGERVYDANLALVLSCVESAAAAAADAAARGRTVAGLAACKLTGLTDPSVLERLSAVLPPRPAHPTTVAAAAAALSAADQARLARLDARLSQLATAAQTARVRLLVDAEQTYLQPAIDWFVLRLQARHNREAATVFNTYQCYLRDAPTRVAADVARAQAHGYIFAAKAVRGAYMVQERERAARLGLPDPIHPTSAATHACYDDVVGWLLRSVPAARREVVVATHNEASVQAAVAVLAALQARPGPASGVFFGQLLGMCDHVSYALAQRGHAVYKYVPYGPIDEVIPYLIRRAQENAAVMAGAAKERRLVRQELRRRLLGRA